MNGNTKNAVTISMFNNVSRANKTWMKDGKLGKVEHKPCGLMLHQPSLLRGEGVWEARACLYDAKFRRLTVAKIKAAIEKGKDFSIDCGVNGPYVQTWVMPKFNIDSFDEDKMKNYVSLVFATDIQTASELYPRTDGHLDFGKIRKMMGDFTIVSKLPDGTLHDLHRDGLIYGITEHTEYISTMLGVDLGPLHGTTRLKKDIPVSKKTQAARSEAKAFFSDHHDKNHRSEEMLMYQKLQKKHFQTQEMRILLMWISMICHNLKMRYLKCSWIDLILRVWLMFSRVWQTMSIWLRWIIQVT